MKTHNSSKKLALGLVLVASFFILYNVIGGADGITLLEKTIKIFLSAYIPESIAALLGTFCGLGIGVFMIYAIVTGAFKIGTFNQYLRVYEDNTPGGVIVSGNGNYPEINRILSYRESRLCGLSPEKGAELCRKTAIVDSLYSGYNRGASTEQALSYMESKLCGMNPDKGLNYLSGNLDK